MDSYKKDIENLLDRIKLNDEALKEAEHLEINLQEQLLSSLGHVVWGIAVNLDPKWVRYRDYTVADLITELGLEVEGRPTEKPVRPLPFYLNPILEEVRRLDRDRDRKESQQKFWAQE